MKVWLGDAEYEVDWLSLDLVRDNATQLQERGLYERALLAAFGETNHALWSLEQLRGLFEIADRARLRAAGDPLPGAGPFILYRGVAGPKPERRIPGLSWTRSIESARSFAHDHASRFASDSDPGVYRITVDELDVLAYTNRKEEEEFIVLLPASVRPQRVE